MICQTELFKRSLGWLDICKSNRIFPKLALIYTKEMGDKKSLYADITTDSNYHITAKLVDHFDDNENVEFSIVVDKLYTIVNSIKDPSFELIQRPNNIVIQSSSGKHKLTIFGGVGSIPGIPLPTHEPESTNLIKYSVFNKLIESYMKTLVDEDTFYTNMYMKDYIISASPQFIRKRKVRNTFPYPVFINKEIHKLLQEMATWGTSVVNFHFYDDMVVIENDQIRMLIMRNENVEGLYEKNIIDFDTSPDIDTFFYLNKDVLTDIYTTSKPFIKQNNNFITLDVQNNKIVSEGDDVLTWYHDFQCEGNFTYKTVYFPNLITSLDFQDEKVKVYSDVDPKGFLYYSYKTEQIALVVVK